MARVVRAAPDALDIENSAAPYRRGKPRKRLAAPRAVEHGFLKAAKSASSRTNGTNGREKRPVTSGHEDFKARGLELMLADERVGKLVAEDAGVPAVYQAKVAEGAERGLDPVDRAHYAALETRKEIAATHLGMGATFEEAAEAVGVSAATIRGYLEDRVFRERVEELRGVVRNRVAGRIEAWMDRLTADPEKLDERDPKVVLGVYDRISGPVGRAAPAHVEQNNLTVNNYPDFMGRLAGITGQRPAQASVDVDDPGAQGGDFPIVGSDGPPVAG